MNKLIFLLTIFLGIMIVGMVSAIGSAPTIDGNVTLYFKFNNNTIGENQTYIVDQSGYGNNATNYNNTIFVNNSILNDYSMYFNSSQEQFLKVADTASLDIPQNFTIAFWVKRQSTPSSSQFVIAKEGDGTATQWDVQFDALNRISFRAGLPSGISTPTVDALANNRWHYVVITGDKNETGITSIYVDGILEVSGNATNGTTAWNINSFPVYIGRRNTFTVATNLNDTYLDELVFSQRKFTGNEIWNNYIQYSECLNITSNMKVRAYTPICPTNQTAYGKNFITSIENNTFINFTGSHIVGNGTGALFDLSDVNNLTLQGLNTDNYTYAVHTTRFNNFVINNGNIDSSFNGWLLIDNSNNVVINNTLFGQDNGNVFVSGLYFRNGGDNISVVNSRFRQCTSFGCIAILNLTTAKNILIDNDVFQGSSSMHVRIIGSQGITITNNNFNDSNNNFDSYNTAVSILGNNPSMGGRFAFTSKNILIRNNTINNIGCSAILAQGIENISIINNNFTYNQNISVNKTANCGYEPITAIDLIARWKTWTSDGFENYTDNLTILGNYTFANINISGNTFSGYPVLLRSQRATNLTHDLANYWFRSFATPNYYDPRTDYYLSNSFENAFTTYNLTNNNPVVVRDLLGSRYAGYSTTIPFVSFTIYKNYSWYQNTNQSYVSGCGGNCLATYPFVTEQYNLTKALLHNGTNVCNGSSNNIWNNNGNVNFTLIANESCWVLDNYNVTESIIRQYDPIFINGTTNVKYIRSNLTQITTPIIINNSGLNCSLYNSIFLTNISTPSGTSNVTTICNSMITTGYNFTILRGTSKIEFVIEGSNSTGGGTNTTTIIPDAGSGSSSSQVQKQVNKTSQNISISGLTRALIYNNTYSVLASKNIPSNNGQINLTIRGDETIYILNNYYKDERYYRDFDPLIRTNQAIKSNLIDKINITFILRLTNSNYIYYSPNNTDSIKIYNSTEYLLTNEYATINLSLIENSISFISNKFIRNNLNIIQTISLSNFSYPRIYNGTSSSGIMNNNNLTLELPTNKEIYIEDTSWN